MESFINNTEGIMEGLVGYIKGIKAIIINLFFRWGIIDLQIKIIGMAAHSKGLQKTLGQINKITTLNCNMMILEDHLQDHIEDRPQDHHEDP